MTTAGQRWYRGVYLKSYRWKLLRWLRHRLDRGRCQECGCRPQPDDDEIWLETHHKSYQWTVEGWSYFFDELGDITTLCNQCHAKAHNRRP